jgi:hypothetical protein
MSRFNMAFYFDCRRWMKRISLLLFLVLCVFGCKSEQDQQGISGRYLGTQRFGIGQVSSPFLLILSQRGNIVTGQVTPPFSNDPVAIEGGEVNGTTVRFDRKVGNITYRYEATIQNSNAMAPTQIGGGLSPLGCLNPSSGEPCLSDSNGSFTASKQ